jgi:hypothetical protein
MEAFSDLFAFLAGVPAMAGLVLTALIMFLTSDWRLSLTALLVQYVFVGLALTRFIQAEVALVKILVGVLAVSILYLTARRVQEEAGSQQTVETSSRLLGLSIRWGAGPLGLPLRLLTVVLLTLGLVRLFTGYRFPLAPADISFVVFWMGGLGIMGLALSGDPLRVATAMQTILAGFDLVFAALEPSLTIAGFWGALTLMAALAFSYLAMAHALNVNQVDVDEEEMEL